MMIATARLILRPIEAGDLEFVHALHSMPELAQFNTLPIPKSLDETKIIVDESLDALKSDPIQSYCYCIVYNDELIGMAGMFLGKPKYKSAETWCKLDPDYWNKGFATEILNALLNFGFNDLKLHRISAGCAVENTASKKVMEKAGMTLEGTQRKSLPLSTGWMDTYEFAILETDSRKY